MGDNMNFYTQQAVELAKELVKWEQKIDTFTKENGTMSFPIGFNPNESKWIVGHVLCSSCRKSIEYTTQNTQKQAVRFGAVQTLLDKQPSYDICDKCQ